MKHDSPEYRIARLEKAMVIHAATLTTLQKAISRLVMAAGKECAQQVALDVIVGIEEHVAKVKSDDSSMDGILRKQRRCLSDFAAALKGAVSDD